jgi:hypothetical protein
MKPAVVFKLAEPVAQGSETISELSVREPRAKDLRKFPTQAKNLGEMLDFAAHLVAQPPSVIDQLCLADAMGLFEVIMSFLPDGLKTGPSS